ncbi:MAG: helix-hairpin-helix domain-containing protein [Longimicrobiales bacterium]|nr:helix-hairpin-helix domain-containing protein [Longimicrobiales bacterium]
MHDPEASALSRAAVVLVAVSVVRWVASSHHGDATGPAVGDSTVLAAHVAATDSAADDGERRSRPLEEGERVDPNTAPETELDRLPGVGPSTAAAIVAARDTLPFGRIQDLLSVRGIGPATLERLRPWLRISPEARAARARIDARARRRGPSVVAGSSPGGVVGAGRIDVNRADPAELQRLPGIGPALASRIVAERAESPFVSVEDLVRVRGIGPGTVAKLRGMAWAGGGA